MREYKGIYRGRDDPIDCMSINYVARSRKVSYAFLN